MRTVPQACIDALNAPRVVGARLTFRQKRLVFSDYALQDSLGLSDPSSADACLYSTGILRVVNFNNLLYYQEVLDPSQLGPGHSWPNWVASAYSLKAGSRPGCASNYLWIQKSTGSIYRYSYPAWGSNQMTTSLQSKVCTLAPVGTGASAYVQYLDGEYLRLAYIDTNGVYDWPGRIYGDIQTAQFLDAANMGSVDYIYVMDRNAGHILEITRQSNGLWGGTREIVPIDPIDNTMGLTLGYVTIINSQVFVTGHLVRTSDGDPVAMDIFTVGPRRFTTGRDMYITNVNTGGKLFLIGSTVYYVGVNNVSTAPATMLVGYDNASLKTVTSDIASLKFAEGETRTGQVDLEVASNLVATPVTEGNECTLELSYNGNWAQITKFGVDQIDRVGYEAGQNRTISGSTVAMKALSSWFPDASIWLPSQAKVSAHPSALDEIIRARGTYKVSGGPLVMNELNKPGVLYSVGRASRGGLMRAKFLYPSGDFSARYGVGINYYQESQYDASIRLGKPQAEVTEDEYGDNGIVAIWGPTEYSGNPGVGLYLWSDSELTLLTSAALTIPADAWHWLQITFNEGLIRVMYRLNSSTDWTQVISHVYVNETRLPWKRETFGHGVIYLENITDHANGWGFYSDDTVIPVDSLPFPEGVSSQILNGGFETLGAGGADVFANWIEVKGDANDQIVADTVKVHSGLRSAKLVSSGQGTDTYLYQNINTYPGQGLVLSFYARGDGTQSGLAKLYDVTHSAWIDPLQPIETANSTTYEWRKARYTVPTGCNQVRLCLYAPTQIGTCYFDDVLLYNFPASETVIVDSEQIVYTAKSPDLAATDQLKVITPNYRANSETFNGFEIDVDTQDNVHTDGYYNDMALVIEEGSGAGRAFKVTGYDAIAPQLWIPTGTYTPPDTWQDHIGQNGYGYWADSNSRRIFVDRDPSGAVGEGAKVRIVKCLHVGYRDDAEATTHDAGLVSLYRDLSVEMDWVDSFSSDLDNCLEDAISEVVTRAGAGTASFTHLLSSLSLSANYVPITVDNARNFVVDMTIPTMVDTDDVGVVFRLAGDGSTGYRVTLNRVGSAYYLVFWICTGSTWSVAERLPLWFTPSGSLRFSVQEDAFSVWINDYFLHTFRDGTYTSDENAGFVSKNAKALTVVFPELSDFIEDLIIDSRTGGLSVIEQMLDGRIVFYCGDELGGIRFYRSRENLGSLPDILFDYEIQSNDTMISRLRLEGIKVLETADFTKLRLYGNLFAIANNKYASTIADLLRASGATIEDIRTQAILYKLTTLVHPALQAGDYFTIALEGSSKTVDVRGVTMSLQVQEDSLDFLATIEGTDHYAS